jgi:EAL domain-containing protein (putative c-di-GMP-specific phosphodiesterase class I)
MSSEAVPETASKSDVVAALSGGIRSVYQPIVDLEEGDVVVGYEALARGPLASALESPVALFGAAREHGLVAELDRACCAAALDGALRAGLRPPTAVFINVEPEAIGTELDGASRELLRDAGRRLNIFFEVTERALTDRPAELLDSVARMRAAGFAIALDDVGADPRSLALLPLLRPDVVKLDISLIHNHPSRQSGEVMNGVCAYAEQTGAIILAEGLENETHVLAARSMGATLGQGWYFGRPEPLGADAPSAGRGAVSLQTVPLRRSSSPVEIVHARRKLKVGRKDVLLSVTRALEAQALERSEYTVVVATFQHVRHFTPATRRRYERLGARTSLTVALGVGMPDPTAPGVRGADLEPDESLAGEWDIAVLGPHYAAALVARDVGDTGPDPERRFEFVLTFDRELVVDVAAALISRVSPLPPGPSAPG